MQNTRSSCVRYTAELFGTLVLVLMGVGSAVIAGSAIGNLGVSLTFGFTLLILIYTIGPVSGCHINPAVSIGLFFLNNISGKDAFFYIVAQLVGASIGAWLIYVIASGKMDHTVITSLGANGFDEFSPGKYTMMAVGITEALMTALLLIVIFATLTEKFDTGFIGIAVGLTLAVIHLFTIPISNTSVNFARSFGPAIVIQGGALQQLWLFAAAQFVGVIIAIGLYKMIYCQSNCN